MDKIRKDLLNIRNSIPRQLRADHSAQITYSVLNLPEVYESNIVLIYASIGSEVITDNIILTLLSEGKQVYLPVCHSLKPDFKMDFYEIDSLDDLCRGLMNIREPRVSDSRIFSKESSKANKVAALMPLLGFDDSLNRLGYGAGFYDRYLARMDIPSRIGLAYECQRLDKIEAKPTDVPLTMVVSEKQIYY